MKRSSDGGQAALILIMIMAVVGAVSVGVAGRSVENLRSSEIESTSSQSFLAAESALELALQTKGSVQDPEGKYSAVVASGGADGFVSDLVGEGDVVQVSLVGAVGVNPLNIYWNDPSAIMISLINNTGSNYSVSYYTADPDGPRALSSKFGTAGSPPTYTKGSYTFKTVSFGNKMAVPINLGAAIAPKLVRIKVLYSGSSVGIEPVGGTLADGQTLTVNAIGTAESNVSTNLVFSKYSDRVPVVFDNVLFTNGSLSQ